ATRGTAPAEGAAAGEPATAAEGASAGTVTATGGTAAAAEPAAAARAAGKPPVADGDYVVRSTLGARTVLDVAGASRADGADVRLWSYNGTAAQRWRVSRDAATGLYSLTSLASGRALDVAGASTRPGTDVRLWTANGTAAQRFELVPVAPRVAPSTARVAAGAYELRPACSGKALDVAGASAAAGADVRQWSRNSTCAQRFWVEPDPGGYHRVFNVGSGLALDVAGADLLPGADVRQWSWNGTAAQLWSLRAGADGTVVLVSAANGLALDVAGASRADGAGVRAWTPNGTAAQRWRLVAVPPLPAGTVTLRPARSLGSAVDVAGGSAAPGTALQAHRANGTPAQKLVVGVRGDGTLTLRPVCSGLHVSPGPSGSVVQSRTATAWSASLSRSGSRRGLVLTAPDGRALAAGGASLSLARATGDASQAFCPLSVGLVDDGVYTISSAVGGKVLDVAGGSWKNGANVQIYSPNGSGAQAFRIEPIGGNRYRITSAMTGKALDVAGAANRNGANVQQYARNGTGAQIWTAKFNDAGYLVFINKATNRALDVAGARNANGTNVDIWQQNDTAAQNWRVIPTSYTPDSVLQRALNHADARGSSTRYLITVDLSNTRTIVFEGSRGDWTPIRNWTVSVGAPSTPTVTGDFTVSDRGYSFGSGYTCYYWTRFYGGYLFHSVLYNEGTRTIQDGRLGYKISHGCVRMNINDAKWIHDSIPSGTHVHVYN
ncbi:MAG: RICIN domain-containing protein, partial [Actinomycetota bacterium]|nr:RICIN domain-containing protein [Actinomycetota bacterium]